MAKLISSNKYFQAGQKLLIRILESSKTIIFNNNPLYIMIRKNEPKEKCILIIYTIHPLWIWSTVQ